MSQINKFSELEVGKEYNIFIKEFNTTNKARFISHDTTDLKREITYWQYSKHEGTPITAIRFKQMLKDGYYPKTFALWKCELDEISILNID